MAANPVEQQEKIERLTLVHARTQRLVHNLCVTMQAAYIEWKHGRGAEAAMRWIENQLDGPDLIPDQEEPFGTDAQEFFNQNRLE